MDDNSYKCEHHACSECGSTSVSTAKLDYNGIKKLLNIKKVKNVIEHETGIIIQRKLELILELLIMMGDDDKKLFSFMRKELEQVLYIFKQIK